MLREIDTYIIHILLFDSLKDAKTFEAFKTLCG